MKPYTSEELRLHRTAEDVSPRLRATVEALERVTKERDEARGAYKDAKALVVMLDDAIKCGAGWAKSSGERLEDAWAERDAALAACGEMRAALEKVLDDVFDTMRPHDDWNAKNASLLLERSALGRGWVSPEAFDAALRELARRAGESFTAGRDAEAKMYRELSQQFAQIGLSRRKDREKHDQDAGLK